MMGVLDTLNAATPIRRTLTICLDGSAVAEHEAIFARLEQAGIDDDKAGSGASMADPHPHTTAVIEELEQLRERMLASEVTFIFERVDWTDRIAMQAEHTPREGNLGDQMRGYNIDTWTPAIIKRSCLSVTDGHGDTATVIPDETWAKLLGDPGVEGDPERPKIAGVLNVRQVSDMLEIATGVNDGETRIPFSARSLLASQSSGASSTPPEAGPDLPRSDSEAGNPPGSPTSSESPTSATPTAESSVPAGSSGS